MSLALKSVGTSWKINSVQEAGGGTAHLEYWIPAEEMTAFNDAIVGEIKVVAEFR